MIHHTEGSDLKVPIHLGLLIFNNLFFQVNRVRISFPILFHISYIIICTYYSFHHEQSLPTNLKKISTFCNLKKNKKKKAQQVVFFFFFWMISTLPFLARCQQPNLPPRLNLSTMTSLYPRGSKSSSKATIWESPSINSAESTKDQIFKPDLVAFETNPVHAYAINVVS